MNGSRGTMQKEAFFAAISLRDEMIIYGKAPRVHGYEMREKIREILKKRYLGISDYEELIILVQDRTVKENNVRNFCEGRINREEGYTHIGYFRKIHKDLN